MKGVIMVVMEVHYLISGWGEVGTQEKREHEMQEERTTSKRKRQNFHLLTLFTWRSLTLSISPILHQKHIAATVTMPAPRVCQSVTNIARISMKKQNSRDRTLKLRGLFDKYGIDTNTILCLDIQILKWETQHSLVLNKNS